jgi:hypothetical protein
MLYNVRIVSSVIHFWDLVVLFKINIISVLYLTDSYVNKIFRTNESINIWMDEEIEEFFNYWMNILYYLSSTEWINKLIN